MSRQFYAADIYTFSGGNLGSNVLRYCGGDQDISVNGALYSAGGQTGPFFDRKDNKAKCHWKIGVDVDSLVFDVLPGSATLFGAPFLSSIHAGIFDGADVLLERVFMPTYGDATRGTVRYFAGRVADIDFGRSIVTFTVNSHLELLNTPLPRNLFQPPCSNSLGDANCLATVPTTTGAVTGGTNAVITATLAGGPFIAGAFDLGKLTFTSGVLNGLSATVKTCSLPSPSTISLLGYFAAAPSPGDTFVIAFGCNKSPSSSNGCLKFSNINHFRGDPYVPQPSTAV